MRTIKQIEDEITLEWQSFQDADLAELVEEYGRIPHQRHA